MFENIFKFFKKAKKDEKPSNSNSKSAAKERLHLVLMQDRANVSADFLDLMKQEIIEVIKKYIEVDESAIDVRLTNKENEDGTNGAPALYANIPIITIKNDARKMEKSSKEEKDGNNKNIEETKSIEKENNNNNKVEENKLDKKVEADNKSDKKAEIEKKEDKSNEEKKSNNENKSNKEDNSEAVVIEEADKNVKPSQEDNNKEEKTSDNK